MRVYYFQVTDPSGRQLLSTNDDADCRQVEVDSSGKIVRAVPHDDGNGPCQHARGTNPNPAVRSPNGTTPIQLWPYEDTTNRGGVYKVWLISTANGCGTSASGSTLTFKTNCAMTDNFSIDFQDQPACAAWHDDFNRGTLDRKRWAIVNGPAPGTSGTNTGIFDPNHVSLGGGLLTLTLTQQLDTDDATKWISTGALIHTQVPCGLGTYEWRMRMGSVTNGPAGTGANISGGVSAGFTFWNNSEHEIAFEHSAAPANADDIFFVNFHNQDSLNRDPLESEGTVTIHDLDLTPHSQFEIAEATFC